MTPPADTVSAIAPDLAGGEELLALNPQDPSKMTAPPRLPQAGARRPIVWIGCGVSLVFLYFFLRNVEWRELSASLAGAHYIYLVPAMGFWFLSLFIRVVRWKVMVHHLKPMSMDSLVSSMCIGFMATDLLPARVGELIRAAVLARRERLSVSSVFATIVVERIFDLLTVILFMVLVLLYIPATGEHAETLRKLRFFGGIFGAVIVAAGAFLVLLKAWPERVKQALEPILARLPAGASHRVHDILDNFAEGLGMLSGWAEMGAIVALSVGLWLTIGLINWALSFAFGIPMSVLGGCLIFVITAFAIALPQAPSFIGVFHVAVETSLKLLGAATVLAKSYAIVLWAISVFPPIALGLYFLWRDGMSLAELTRTAPGQG